VKDQTLAKRRVRLLGIPAILDPEGQNRVVRGHQAWALLARVLLTRKPLSRTVLSEELFPESQDPLGSLRWCLAALRKALDSSDSLVGDPIELNLPLETEVDVWLLEQDKLDIDEVAGLLDGITPQCSAGLETWILAERARISATIDGQLRREVMRLISVEDFSRAIQVAEQAVRRDVYDERAHILLVKSLALSGQVDAALKHVEATEQRFREELDALPTPALRSAARRSVASPPGGISLEVHVNSLLQSGAAALAAGAVDAGIDNLRRAVSEAEKTRSKNLFATATLELGVALVHAIRGFDEEGAILLRQATEMATARGYSAIASAGFRELGYVEALAGRRPSAAQYLSKAVEHADNPDQLAGSHAVTAFNLIDWGKIDAGLEHYGTALELAREAGNRRRETWALGMGAWGQLAAGNLEAAQSWLHRCLSLVDDQRWLAFRPWPTALLCEARLRRDGPAPEILPMLEEAFSTSCQLRDPCWEAIVSRSIAQWHVAQDDFSSASTWLEEGQKRCGRETDSYVALQIHILGDIAELKRLQGDRSGAADTARKWVSAAASAHMDAQVAAASKVLAAVG
jgi:DNA-binding SARP family transcriptional activator